MTRRRRPNLPLPALPLQELQEALAVEHQPRVRKRLVGLQAIAEGASRAEAAKRAKAGLSTLDSWLRAARRSGWKSVMRAMPGTKPRKIKDAAHMQEQVRDALSGKLDAATRARLIAVDRVLGGERVDATATEFGITGRSIYLWLGKLQRDGVQALLKQEPPCVLHIEADGAALSKAAARERNPRMAKRLKAMAYLAEGLPVFDAGLRVGVHGETVRKWADAFRSGGVDAVRGRPQMRPSKLSSEQMAELSAIIQDSPGISWAELLPMVRQRFRVDYTPNGLSRLVRQTLGFQRKGQLLVRPTSQKCASRRNSS